MQADASRIWLQPVGTTEEPLDNDWTGNNSNLLSDFWSTVHPESIQPGDLVVYYAAVWHKAVAIVKVMSDPVGGKGDRWQWRVPICPLVVLEMDAAPDLQDAEVDSNRKYKELSADEYERLRALMVGRVAR